MDYSNKHNKTLLKRRIQATLGKRECHWFPLTLNQDFYKTFTRLVGARDIGVVVLESSPEAFRELAVEMKGRAEEKLQEAAAKRELPVPGSGLVRGGRMSSKIESEAKNMEKAATDLTSVAQLLEDSIVSVAKAREELQETDEACRSKR